MRVYTSSNSAIWLLIMVVVVSLMILVGLGTFILTTPIGLAILTFFVIRHYYKKYQFKRASENLYGDYQETSRRGREWSFSNDQETQTNAYNDKTEKYEQRSFSRDQANVAEDVEFKEIK